MAGFETMMLVMKIGLTVLNLGIDTSTITACYASRPLLQAEHMIRKKQSFFFFKFLSSDPNNSGVASSETVLAYWDSLGISNGSQVKEIKQCF